MSDEPIKDPGDVAGVLQGDDPAVREAQTASSEPGAGQGLPNLDDVPCEPGQTVTRELAQPVRVLVGPLRKQAVITSMEKSELGPGQRDGVKAPGETLYMARPQGRPEVSPGGYQAGDLFVLDEPAVIASAPAPPAKAVIVSLKAAALAEQNGVELSTVAGTGKGGSVTVADVRALIGE